MKTGAVNNRLKPSEVSSFRKNIYSFYDRNSRSGLPWRQSQDPYNILVSEFMLQQTQVERVIDKYREFISVFPDFRSLAKAPLSRVLYLWQGLGYNRRALALHTTARMVTDKYSGTLPSSVEELETLPGIGYATASAIAAFAFHKPVIFIETNIRRVFIYFFFHNRKDIRDSQILPLVEQTLDRKDPHKWYSALMDYGSTLKKSVENPNRRSAHYQRQSRFHGSNRQVRGMILKALVHEYPATGLSLIKKLNQQPEQVRENLVQLEKEGFVRRKGKKYYLP
jgi:A/G-specific adenine glycosylase